LYVRSRVLSLERAYPPLPSETTSTPELRTPTAPGTRTAYVDAYGARVPLSALRRSADRKDAQIPLEELWPKAFLRTDTMKLEAKIVGKGSQGDLGEQGFYPGQPLVGGALQTRRPPARGSPLLVSWDNPPYVVRFFERLAAWGYPWRMMEGGRHEWSIGQVGRLPGESEDMVEVRFSAAHDYKIIEGEAGEGKIIPQWVLRGHRAYARLLLDEAVRGL
ncbi:hypothetical protein PHLGIDRAFT_48797, partial [Phlebiopsis gigantea 11061_1 CR5-6]